MRDVNMRVAVALAATISLLERAEAEKKPPNMVVASDKMFKQMLADYRAALAEAISERASK